MIVILIAAALLGAQAEEETDVQSNHRHELPSTVHEVRYGPGFYAVAGGDAGNLYVHWDGAESPMAYPTDHREVNAFDVSPDGHILAGVDSWLYLWEPQPVSNHALVKRIRIGGRPFRLALSPDNSLGFVCYSAYIVAYNLFTGKRLWSFYIRNNLCAGISVTADGSKVITAQSYTSGVAAGFILSPYGQLIKEFSFRVTGRTKTIAVTPDGSRMVTGEAGKVRVHDASGNVLQTCDTDAGFEGTAARLTDNGMTVVHQSSFGGEGAVEVRDVESCEVVGRLVGTGAQGVSGVAVRGGGTEVLAATHSPSGVVEWALPFKQRRCAEVRGFNAVPLQGADTASDGRIFVHGTQHVAVGAEATAWFPSATLPPGRSVEVSCCDGDTDCTVMVAVYHCPLCSDSRNGGYPNTLLRRRGVKSVACPATTLTVKDAGPDWENKHHRMAAFVATVHAGDTVFLPPTTTAAELVVFFTSTSPLPDNWCPAEGVSTSAETSGGHLHCGSLCEAPAVQLLM